MTNPHPISYYTRNHQNEDDSVPRDPLRLRPRCSHRWRRRQRRRWWWYLWAMQPELRTLLLHWQPSLPTLGAQRHLLWQHLLLQDRSISREYPPKSPLTATGLLNILLVGRPYQHQCCQLPQGPLNLARTTIAVCPFRPGVDVQYTMKCVSRMSGKALPF